MSNKWGSGFTLLESLVVVCIVAILVAVAVPQYKVAVARVHYMRLQNITRKLVQAYQRYYLAQGGITLDLEALDIQLPPRPESIIDREGIAHPYPPAPYPFGNADGETSTGYITAQYDKIQIVNAGPFVVFISSNDLLPAMYRVVWMPQENKLVELCDFLDENAVQGRKLCHAAGARRHSDFLDWESWTW
ncbi:MAG: prepilin-type N-terminal cleavage/methylation domain-containing protein [Elusimicrobiaceae bacterium]|nr:prepilin-type N-terminal cleavage/methylation domain-containing protein [Elusimicrobiaceae bacterium]